MQISQAMVHIATAYVATYLEDLREHTVVFFKICFALQRPILITMFKNENYYIFFPFSLFFLCNIQDKWLLPGTGY